MEREKNVQVMPALKKRGKAGGKFIAAVRSAARRFSGGLAALAAAFSQGVLGGRLGEDHRVLRAAAAGGFFLLTAFLAAVVSGAAFPGGVYPAGFALIASLGGTRWRFHHTGENNARLLESAVVLAAFSGTAFAALFLPNGFYYFLLYTVLFLIRGAKTGARFDDSVLFRVTLSASFAAAGGLLFSALANFTLKTVLAAVTATILVPIFTYLLSGFYLYSFSLSFAGENALPKKQKVYVDATVLTLVYLFLYAIREVEWQNFSIAFLISVLVTLAASKIRGSLFGAGAGMICGMACGPSALAPILAVGGFFAGLFFAYSGLCAVMIAFVTSCGYALISDSFDQFGLLTADYLFAMILFLPLMRVLPREEKEPAQTPILDKMRRETVQSARAKLKNISDAFSSLSEAFYTVSDTMKKPQLTETTRLVSDACSEICTRCAASPVCWGKAEPDNAQRSMRLASKLLQRGKIEPQDFGAEFSDGCVNLEKLTENINRRFALLSGDFYKNNKTSLLAGEYSTVSRLIQSTAGEINREWEHNPVMEKLAQKVLQDLGLTFRRVICFGDRLLRVDVYGLGLDRGERRSEPIRKAFEKAFECHFEAPSFHPLENGVLMRLRRRRAFLLECAKAGAAKKGESMTGDSVSFFENDRDLFYALLCDGMGSGREAAFTSRLASLFIEKLMLCSTPKNVTLEMLNTFLMSKSDETFTSVDLLEVDLMSGEGSFIKAGAAPSFVLRGDRVHKIESRTPPAGILRKMCAEKTAFRLVDGDFIIMLSDGCMDAGDEGMWLVSYLSGLPFDTAAELCDLIIKEAKKRFLYRDDLSVTVVRVQSA